MTSGDPGPASVVSLRGLRKVYFTGRGEVLEAISGIDLTLQAGERLGIVGPSGCGKSSLLRILAELDRDYLGCVEWGVSANDPHRLVSATVFQTDSIFPWMTVGKNVGIGLSGLLLSSGQRLARINDHLSLVGLDQFKDAFPHELSGGMRQRVAIARALATMPHLLLMDEPLAALDAQTRLILQRELHRIWEATRSTVVYVTHDIEEAVSLCDRVVVLAARPGRIREIVEIPFARSLDPLQRRRSPSFGDLQLRIWAMISSEVGSSLSIGAAT